MRGSTTNKETRPSNGHAKRCSLETPIQTHGARTGSPRSPGSLAASRMGEAVGQGLSHPQGLKDIIWEGGETFLGGLCWIFRRRQWHLTPVLLPGKSHGWRSLVGYSPWGRKESDMIE